MGKAEEFGYATEFFILGEAIQQGFRVAKPEGPPDGDDLYLRYPGCDWVSVQVKSSSHLNYGTTPQFALFRNSTGKQCISSADYHILRHASLAGVYVVPTRELPQSSCYTLSKKKQAKYLNRWDLLKVRKEKNAK